MRFKIVYEYYSPFSRRMETAHYPSKMESDITYTRDEALDVLELLGKSRAARGRIFAIEYPLPREDTPEILNYVFPHDYLDRVAQDEAEAEAEEEF